MFLVHDVKVPRIRRKTSAVQLSESTPSRGSEDLWPVSKAAAAPPTNVRIRAWCVQQRGNDHNKRKAVLPQSGEKLRRGSAFLQAHARTAV